MSNKKWNKSKVEVKVNGSSGYVPFSQRNKPEPTFDEMFPVGLVVPVVKTSVWSGNFKAAIEKKIPVIAPAPVVEKDETEVPRNHIVVKQSYCSDACNCQCDDCPCPCHSIYSDEPYPVIRSVKKLVLHDDEDSISVPSSNDIVECEETSDIDEDNDEIEGEDDGSVSE
jgi:hypothetical protein